MLSRYLAVLAPDRGRASSETTRCRSIGTMRQGLRRSAAGLALAIVLGLAACGGDDDASPTVDDGRGAAQAEGERGDARSQGGGRRSGPSQPSKVGKGDKGSSGFTPQPHDDSGGGAEQFRVKGGDNSVQEFGSEAGGDQFEEAAAALHGFLDARAQGAWAAACRHLASDVVASLEQLGGQGGASGGCATLLEKLTNPAAVGLLRKEARRADVGSLRTEGDRAFAIYRGLDRTIMAIPMTREDGEWKVAALAGTPLN